MAFVVSETESLDAQRVSALGPVASAYKDCITQLKELQGLLSGKVRNWPAVKRDNMPEYDAHTDYSWFCDYFGNAISPIGTAVESCQSHRRDPGGDFEAFLRKIDARKDEFTRLRDSIEINRASIPDVADQALESLKKLEASKDAFCGEVSTWLGEQKQPEVIRH